MDLSLFKNHLRHDVIHVPEYIVCQDGLTTASVMEHVGDIL